MMLRALPTVFVLLGVFSLSPGLLILSLPLVL